MIAKNVNGFGHVALQLTDLDEGLRFFHEALGCKKLREFEHDGIRVVSLKAGKTEIEMWEKAGEPPPKPARPLQRPGVNHLAFEVKKIDDVVAGIRDMGYEVAVEVYEPTQGIREAVVYGPDNLEIQFEQQNIPVLIWRSIKGDFK